MVTTTDVVRRKSSFRDTYRRHGYFFREAAILTILIGFGLHLYRVIFGDDLTLQYVVTPESDMLLLIPMTYAAITGILGYRRMVFVNRLHRDRAHGGAGLHHGERATAPLRRCSCSATSASTCTWPATGSAICC